MSIKVGSRYLAKLGWSGIVEITILEISPTGEYYKTNTGWISALNTVILEELE